jgi:hypothetical protein
VDLPRFRQDLVGPVFDQLSANPSANRSRLAQRTSRSAVYGSFPIYGDHGRDEVEILSNRRCESADRSLTSTA